MGKALWPHVAVLLVGWGVAGARAAEPDWIFHHARVVTVDAAFRLAEAVAVKGEGRPSKSAVPSWWIGLVLPCMGFGARTTRPPKASPIAWWPRQTPRMGRRPE